MIRIVVGMIVASSLLLAGAAGAEEISGTVELKGGAVAAGVGYGWGAGVLNFQGKQHNFKLSGISVGDIGATSVTASGTVVNLKNAADFNGNYSAGAAGLTIAGGTSAVVLENQNGVKLQLHSTEIGLRFTIAKAGVKIELKD